MPKLNKIIKRYFDKKGRKKCFTVHNKLQLFFLAIVELVAFFFNLNQSFFIYQIYAQLL